MEVANNPILKVDTDDETNNDESSPKPELPVVSAQEQAEKPVAKQKSSSTSASSNKKKSSRKSSDSSIRDHLADSHSSLRDYFPDPALKNYLQGLHVSEKTYFKVKLSNKTAIRGNLKNYVDK